MSQTRRLDRKASWGFCRIIHSAEQHGINSEPEHEVGDLQDALEIAWELLTPDQRKEVTRTYFEEVHTR